MNIKKLLFALLGFISLTLGAVGIFLPLLPTTPFVLLAAGCFSMSNKKLEAWLQQSRIFGPFIENYRTGCGISKLHKFASISSMWAGMITSMFILRTPWVYFFLCTVGTCVTIHLLMIKTKKARFKTLHHEPRNI